MSRAVSPGDPGPPSPGPGKRVPAGPCVASSAGRADHVTSPQAGRVRSPSLTPVSWGRAGPQEPPGESPVRSGQAAQPCFSWEPPLSPPRGSNARTHKTGTFHWTPGLPQAGSPEPLLFPHGSPSSILPQRLGSSARLGVAAGTLRGRTRVRRHGSGREESCALSWEEARGLE